VVEAEVLEEVGLVVAVLEEADFVEVLHRFEWADLGQVERHLVELVPRE
jgi:hypothetical protein